MGILGGDWIADRAPYFRDSNDVLQYGAVIEDQAEQEFHTDIDITFTMSGQTDAGLTFGASIDLDESDGSGNEGASAAFNNRTQGGEEIFISGPFGNLTMGDTDGALDWALQDIGIGGTLGDLHTTHLGYTGNDFVDGHDDGTGQIARYDYSFGDFAFAVSVDINDMGGVPSGSNARDRRIVRDDILSVGAKYNFSLPAGRLGVGVGWQQRNDWYISGSNRDASNLREGGQATAVSLDAEFDNGFRVILNWADMGNALRTWSVTEEKWHGIGLSYMMDDWLFAANYGRMDEKLPPTSDGNPRAPRWEKGYAFVVNYDLGGGAEVQFGYQRSTCPTDAQPVRLDFDTPDNGRCGTENQESGYSLGVAMKF